MSSSITRYGFQPVRDVLNAERWTVVRAAEEIDVPRTHLGNAVTGRTVPSPDAREGLSKLLNRPVTELFTEDVLAARYAPKGGAK